MNMCEAAGCDYKFIFLIIEANLAPFKIILFNFHCTTPVISQHDSFICTCNSYYNVSHACNLATASLKYLTMYQTQKNGITKNVVLSLPCNL